MVIVLALSGGPHSTEGAFALLTQRPRVRISVSTRTHFSSGPYVKGFANAVSGEGLK